MTLPSFSLLQKVLGSAVLLGLLALAYRAYGWVAVAGCVGAAVMGVLMLVSRTLQVLQRAAHRPPGSVDSAVMLHVRLRKRMPLLQVLAMTRALGEPLTAEDAVPEVWRWTDSSQASVQCEFVNGRLRNWSLLRPDTDPSDAAP